LLALAALWAARVDRNVLLTRQIRLQGSGGATDLHRLLADYERKNGLRGRIATDYLYLRWVPGMAPYYMQCPAEDPTAFRRIYHRPEVRYALFDKRTVAGQVRDALQSPSGPASSRLLGETEEFCFWGKRDAP
jgi:hypothetical protein